MLTITMLNKQLSIRSDENTNNKDFILPSVMPSLVIFFSYVDQSC